MLAPQACDVEVDPAQADGIAAGTGRLTWPHRVRSCVVKPPQPHWFFSSSNTFSASARSPYNCLSVRISLSSEVKGGVFPKLVVRPNLGETKQRLRGVCAIGHR
jgi:hypothetical protein